MNSDAPSPPLEVRLMGGFDVRVSGKPLPSLRSRKEQWLLGLLVLRHDRETSREWLAATLWPDNDEQQALFYLRKGLSNLRSALGAESTRLLSPTPRTVRLNLDGAFADVMAFDEAIKAGRHAEAAELYRGAILPDCHEDWALIERNAREQAYQSSLESLAVSESDSAAAARWLRMLIVGDPYRESAHRQLMQRLSDSGDRAAVTVVFRELQERLRNDLNGDPSPETASLYKELLAREPVAVPLQTTSAVTNRHLPVPLTDLIGRSKEIENVVALIAERRLVTLVASGGVGKTRLSIAVAEAVLNRFEDGVWFVDLSSLTDQSMTAQVTALALGIAEEPGRPIQATIVAAIASRSMLVVLDNCEHFASACAELLQSLLSSCAGLTILATSRQPLQVEGEQVFRVPSLGVPAESATLADAIEYEAVRLFVDRARRVDPNFRLSERNASEVVQICQQLDGIALAIEMAAARLRSLSVTEIRSRLSDRFRLLKSSNRSALPRHQTLRATIDWSYDQLSGAERKALCSASAFAGGWTLEAAESMIEPLNSESVEDLMDSLVDKSLAIVVTLGERTRFRMLETVRQYAEDRAAEMGASRELHDRHLAHFLALAERAEPHLTGADQANWLSLLEQEHDNLRAALAWSIQREGDLESGLRICGALIYFWSIRGHIYEGRSWCEAALQKAEQKDLTGAALAKALNSAGLLSYEQGDYDIARDYHTRSLALWEKLGDEPRAAWSLNGLGLVAKDTGDYELARSYHERSLAIRRRVGDDWSLTQSLGNLGSVAHVTGDLVSGRALLEETVAIRRRAGFKRGTAIMLAALGELLLDEGDIDSARNAIEESLTLRRELADPSGIAECLTQLAQLRCELGDCAIGGTLSEGLELSQSLGRKPQIAQFLASAADVASDHELPLDAARLWGASEALFESFHGREASGSQKRRAKRQAASRKEAGDESKFHEAWREGRAMSVEQASELAMRVAAD